MQKVPRGRKILITAVMLKNYLDLKHGLPAFPQSRSQVLCHFCVYFAWVKRTHICDACPWTEYGKYDWAGRTYVEGEITIGRVLPPCRVWLFDEVSNLSGGRIDYLPDFTRYHREYNATTKPIIDERIKMLQKWLKQMVLEQRAGNKKERACSQR